MSATVVQRATREGGRPNLRLTPTGLRAEFYPAMPTAVSFNFRNVAPTNPADGSLLAVGFGDPGATYPSSAVAKLPSAGRGSSPAPATQRSTMRCVSDQSGKLARSPFSSAIMSRCDVPRRAAKTASDKPCATRMPRKSRMTSTLASAWRATPWHETAGAVCVGPLATDLAAFDCKFCCMRAGQAPGADTVRRAPSPPPQPTGAREGLGWFVRRSIGRFIPVSWLIVTGNSDWPMRKDWRNRASSAHRLADLRSDDSCDVHNRGTQIERHRH